MPESYAVLRILHISCAELSFVGFLLRFYWMSVDSEYLRLKPVKILPHIIDTILLASALGLLLLLQYNPLEQTWLMSKIIFLLLYIALGTFALKRGKTRTIRIFSGVGAIAVFASIVWIALHKNP